MSTLDRPDWTPSRVQQRLPGLPGDLPTQSSKIERIRVEAFGVCFVWRTSGFSTAHARHSFQRLADAAETINPDGFSFTSPRQDTWEWHR